MTVAELIKYLSDKPGDAEIFVEAEDMTLNSPRIEAIETDAPFITLALPEPYDTYYGPHYRYR